MFASSRFCTFRLSFRYKLLLVFTLLTAAISLVICTCYIINEMSEARSQISAMLRLNAESMAETVRLPLYAHDREALNRLAAEALRKARARSVVIRDADGRLLVEARSPAGGDRSRPIVETVSILGGGQGMSVEAALNGVKEGDAPVIGSMSLERGTADLSSMRRRMMVAAISITFGFWLLVTLISNLALRRVTGSFNALMRGLERMRGGNFVTPVEVTADDEPGRAARAINELARSLNIREEENARLTSELTASLREEANTSQRLAASNIELQQEIAERVQAEQAVRDSEQYLRRLVDAMPVGVAWSNHEGMVEYVNDYIVARSGYGRQEFTTTQEWLRRIFPDPDYHDRIVELRRAAIEAAGEGDEASSYEARAVSKDGTVRHLLFKHQVTQQRNLMIIVDITERELFQEQLIKTQKLESLGVLAGGIAHNFNNILTGVLGYISFARMFLDQSHKSFQALEHAEVAGRRAAGMASQLLAFARGGAPVKRPVSLARLVKECLAISLNGKNSHGLADIPEDIHAVIGDEGQLSQAFNNLILNASEAMPLGGAVTVKAENIALKVGKGASGPATFVRITVSDQGDGIPDSIIHKIFDPYFTTKPTGTGLGLASVYSIIQKHGGLISADSGPDRGAVFTVTLPSTGKTPQIEDEPVRVLTPGGGRQARVLVMDDEELVRDFARDSLEFLGYRVSVCVNGDEAVELYRSARTGNDPYFAAILDLTVSEGMGGVEASQRILALDQDARLIVCSGYNFDPIMSMYRQHGFRSAICKPYKADQLDRELERLRNEQLEEPVNIRPGIEQKILASGVARW